MYKHTVMCIFVYIKYNIKILIFNFFKVFNFLNKGIILKQKTVVSAPVLLLTFPSQMVIDGDHSFFSLFSRNTFFCIRLAKKFNLNELFGQSNNC